MDAFCLGSNEDVQNVPRRVIIHIDLDCFYAQVEQKRLAIPHDTPCAVQQWDGLIAVNYAARAKGITRHMRVGEARKACPELLLVHVRTIGEGGTDVPEAEGSAESKGFAKACLHRYRQASGEIIRLLQSQLSLGCPLEKGGLDEMFMDVTAMAEEQLKSFSGSQQPEDDLMALSSCQQQGGANQASTTDLSSAFEAAASSSDVVGGPLQLDNNFDRLLVAGSLIALRMRQAVFAELRMTCSAGVSYNKILAKLGSSFHKPNRQALILPRGVRDMMQTIPLSKIWGLGGKIGTAMEEHFGATTAGQAQLVPIVQLQHALGEERAALVCARTRGQSSDPVVPKSLVKSINSCKSFAATSDLAHLEKWMGILAEELAQRLAEDEADHRRRARTLSLHYTGGRAIGSRQPRPAVCERSVRCHVPQYGREGPSAVALAGSALAALRKLPDALPCVRLALSAGDFSAAPMQGGRSITNFFAASTAGTTSTAAATPMTTAALAAMPIAESTAAAMQVKDCYKRERPHNDDPTELERLRDPLGHDEGVEAAAGSVSNHEAPQQDQHLPDGTDGTGLLEGVNVAEQNRILRDIQLRELLRKGGGRKPPPCGKKQRSMFEFSRR